MNAPTNATDPKGPSPGPPDWRKPVAWLFVGAMVLALGIAVRTALTPNPPEPTDAEPVALQEGVAAFRTGAYGTALELLEPLAKKGDAQAGYWMGQMYEQGLGVKRDVDTAVTWYRKAAEGGWTAGKLQLGEMYFEGTETLQDFTKARNWLDQAAHDGDARAQLDLGRLYANAWGGDKDPIEALVWYELASRQGNYEAQRLRDALLHGMPEDQIAEAQDLAEKMAPEVIRQPLGGAKDANASTATSTQ